jgi:hypothetical protein
VIVAGNMTVPNKPAAVNDFAGLRRQFSDYYLSATFVGRKADFLTLDQWLANSGGDGAKLALLTAPAGRGKSALITRWIDSVRRRGDYQVIFIPVSSRFHTNRPDLVLPALAVELSKIIGETIETLSVGALEAYRDIIAELLRKFDASAKQCLLVIDGADESQLAGWDLGETLLPAKPPPGLRILVTARRLAGDRGAEGWRRRLGWSSHATRVAEIALDKLPLTEVSALVERLVGQAHADTDAVEQLGEEIFRLSERGDPLLVELYAVDIEIALREGGETARAIAQRLSRRGSGLGPYFDNWIAEQNQSFSVSAVQIDFAVVEATLLLLASALGPLRHGELSELLPRVLPGQHVPGKSMLLAPLARFVIGDDEGIDSRGYTLGHPLFGSFLQESQYRDTPLLKRTQQAFLHWGEDVMSELRAGRRSSDSVPAYLLDLYPQHIIRQRDRSIVALAGVLSNEWVEACRQAHKETAFAVAAETILEALLRRLDRPGIPDPLTLGMAVRASLFLSSLREAASSIDPYLLILAIEHGLLDQQSVLTRKALMNPSGRVGLLLSLARESRPGLLDPVALWQEARVIASNRDLADSIFLLDQVLNEAQNIIRSQRASVSAGFWREVMAALRTRLTAPPQWPRLRDNVSLHYRDIWQHAPFEWMVDLMRFVLIEPISAPLLPGILEGIVSGVLTSRRLSPDATEPLNWFAAVFSAIGDDSKNGRLAAAICDILRGSDESANSTFAAYLEGCHESAERVRGSSAILGILIGSKRPIDALQAAMASILMEVDTDFMVRLIATGVLKTTAVQLPQALCEEAWSATAVIEYEYVRLPVRAEILRLMPEKAETFNFIRQEVGERPMPLAELLNVGLPHLSRRECRDLVALLPAHDDRGLRVLEALFRRAQVKPQSADVNGASLQPDARETKKPAEESEFDSLTDYSNVKNGSLEEGKFLRALGLARQTELPHLRRQRMNMLARRAPIAQRRAMTAEALAESGGIDDRSPAWQAIAALAKSAGGEQSRKCLDEALAGVSQLDPRTVVITACNIGYRIPPDARRAWTQLAITAVRRIPSGTEESLTAMSRVVREFKAPLAFAYHCLRLVGRFTDDKRSGWIYNDLLYSRWLVVVGAACVALARYRDMRAGLRVRVSGPLRRRFPRLLFWFPPKPGADLEACEATEENFSAVTDLARSFGEKRRKPFLDRAVILLASLVKAPRETRLWASQYTPVRSLYELADVSTREKVKMVIVKCDNKDVRLHYEICLFPALSEAERSDAAPRLLRDIDPPPARPVVAGSIAEAQFQQLLVLFFHWPSDRRTKALLAMLRVGAHMPRRRWLYDIDQIPAIWPVATSSCPGKLAVSAPGKNRSKLK